MRDINRFYTHDVFVVHSSYFYLSLSAPSFTPSSTLCNVLSSPSSSSSSTRFHRACEWSQLFWSQILHRSHCVCLVCLRLRSVRFDCIALGCVGLFIFNVKRREKRRLAFIVIPLLLGYECERNANRLNEMKRRITARQQQQQRDRKMCDDINAASSLKLRNN